MDSTDEPDMTCHQVAEEEAAVEEEEGQVIGYFQLDNSRLQLVEGENTFYLPPDALGEHVLMTEDGKEGQQIIVVVEEGSEDAVVQAFDARALLGDQTTFTVDQLQGALSESLSLQDQFAGMTTITSGEQQQLLILSEDPDEKECPGFEDTAVVPGASPGEENADTENTLLYQQGLEEVPPEQCSTASEAVHGELQPSLEELPEGTGDLNKSLEALDSGSDVLKNSPGLEVCPGPLPLSGNLKFVAENEQVSEEGLGKCTGAEFGMLPPIIEDNPECSKVQIESGFGAPQAGSEEGGCSRISVDPGKNDLVQCHLLPTVLMRPEEPSTSQGEYLEQPKTTGHDGNDTLIMITEGFHKELLEQVPPTGAQEESVPGTAVSKPSQAALLAASEHYDQLSCGNGIGEGDESFRETVAHINNLPDVQAVENSEDKLVDRSANVLDLQLDCNTQSRSSCKERETNLDQHNCFNVNELFREEKEENLKEHGSDVNELFDKQPDENRDTLLHSVSKEGFDYSILQRNSELDIDNESENMSSEISSVKCRGESEMSYGSETAVAAEAIPSETPADFEQSNPNQMTSSSALMKEEEQIQVTSASDGHASVLEPVKESEPGSSLKGVLFEEAESHLMVQDLEHRKDVVKIKDLDIMEMDKDNCVVKETITDATEHEALQPWPGADSGSTYENADDQLQDELPRSPNSTENQGQDNCEDRYTYSADHDRCLEGTAPQSIKEAEFFYHELQEQDKDKPKGNALSTDSSIVLESGTSGSKEHDSSRELSDLDQSGEKLLAALDLMPCQEASNLPTNGVAKPPPTSKPRDIFPDLKPKRKRTSVSQDEASSLGKKRWSLRTPTTPRKRVIIPDSDDDDFDVYESCDILDDTQNNKSEKAFDELLSFFKIEQAQQEAAEAAGAKKKNAKKSPKGAAPKRKTHRKSLEATCSTPKEMQSPKEVPAAKETPSPKKQRVKLLENVARKNSDMKRQENVCTAPSPSPTKLARKRRSEPTESVLPKKDVLAESCKRIPSVSDTFAGDIHIRCQKPSCSSDKGIPRYHCSKCGFRSARVENIIWHHKQDCPYTKNLHRWDPEPWNQADVPDKSLQQPV